MDELIMKGIREAAATMRKTLVVTGLNDSPDELIGKNYWNLWNALSEVEAYAERMADLIRMKEAKR